MNKYLEVWEPVLRKFEEYYPHLLSGMLDWYPSGRNEITVHLKNQDTLIYNFVTNDIRRNGISETDADDITEDEWRKIFSKKLIDKMYYANISQWRLSELTGISEVSISKYMNGRATPSGFNIDRICRALKCSVSELTDIY